MANTLFDKIKAEIESLKLKITGATPPADFTASISAIQGQLEGFKTDLAAKDTAITAHIATIEGLKTSAITDAATISAHVATIGANTKTISDLKAAAKTAGQNAVDMLASCGVVIADLPEAGKPSAAGAKKDEKVKTRAEMKAMKPADILAFCKAGGQFAD
jgi:hypothetical protein